MKIMAMIIFSIIMLVPVPGGNFVRVTWTEASATCKTANTTLPRAHRRNDLKKSMQLMLNHSLQTMWVDVRRNTMEQWEWITGDKEKFTLTVNDTSHGCAFWDKINHRLESTHCFRRMGFLCQVNDCKKCSYLGHHASRCLSLDSKCLVMFCEIHNWHGARASCLNKHWDLAIIGESEMENMHGFFKNLKCPQLWTGLRREDWVDSDYDSEYFETSLWATDEPSLNGNCTEMRQREKHFTLNAVNCQKKNHVKCMINPREHQWNTQGTEYSPSTDSFVNVNTTLIQDGPLQTFFMGMGLLGFGVIASLFIVSCCFCIHRLQENGCRKKIEYEIKECSLSILAFQDEAESLQNSSPNRNVPDTNSEFTPWQTFKEETTPLLNNFLCIEKDEGSSPVMLQTSSSSKRTREWVNSLSKTEVGFSEQNISLLGVDESKISSSKRETTYKFLGVEIKVPHTAMDENEPLDFQCHWSVDNSISENPDKISHFVYDFKPQKSFEKYINILIKHYIKDVNLLHKLQLYEKLPNGDDWYLVNHKSEINFNFEEPDSYFSVTVDCISIHTRRLTEYKCKWPSPSIDALHLRGFVFPEVNTAKSNTSMFYANITVIVVPDIHCNAAILQNVIAQRPAVNVELDFPLVPSLTWNNRLEIDVSFKDGSWSKVEDQSILGKSLQDIYSSSADPMKGITLANVMIKSISSDPSTSDFSLDFILRRDSSCDILQSLDGLSVPCDKPVGLTNSQVASESGFETCPEEVCSETIKTDQESRRSISSSSTNGTVRVAEESDGFTPKQLQQIEMVFKSCLKSK